MPKRRNCLLCCQKTVKESVTHKQFNSKQLFTETVRSRLHTCPCLVCFSARMPPAGFQVWKFLVRWRRRLVWRISGLFLAAPDFSQIPFFFLSSYYSHYPIALVFSKTTACRRFMALGWWWANTQSLNKYRQIHKHFGILDRPTQTKQRKNTDRALMKPEEFRFTWLLSWLSRRNTDKRPSQRLRSFCTRNTPLKISAQFL